MPAKKAAPTKNPLLKRRAAQGACRAKAAKSRRARKPKACASTCAKARQAGQEKSRVSDRTAAPAGRTSKPSITRPCRESAIVTAARRRGPARQVADRATCARRTRLRRRPSR